jgi:hypothetical protein
MGYEKEGDGDTAKCMPSHKENTPAEEEEFNRDMETLYSKPEKLNFFCNKYNDKDEFYVPSGYRRIPGDTCFWGLDLHEKIMECPSRSVSHTGFGVLIILVILAAVMGGVTLLSRHERFRFMVENMSDSMPGVKYLVVGDSYKPESVFDEDFALVDDNDDDEPAVIGDEPYAYDAHSRGMSSTAAGSGHGQAAAAPAVDDDPFNPTVQPVEPVEDLLQGMSDM